MPSKSGSDKSFEAIRFNAALGLFLFSMIFLISSIWFIYQHAQERERLGQVIGDNRQLVENQRLMQGAVEQLRNNLARQNDRLKTKAEALASSEQARLTLERERRERLIQIQQRAEKIDAIRSQLAPALRDISTQIFLTQDQITIRLPGKNLFASAETTLQPEGTEILASVARILNAQLTDLPIRIEGHTDDVPIGDNLQNTFPTNLHLSAARASAAVDFLISEGGLTATLLEAVGKGDTTPIADNSTTEGRAQNRRIDIIIQLDALE
ncbi:MAG: OmpA family protein [Verrucomicrobiota bacterium]